MNKEKLGPNVGETRDKRIKLKRHEQVRGKNKKNEKNSSTLGRRERKKEELFFSLAPSLKEQVEKTHASKSMIQNKGFE